MRIGYFGATVNKGTIDDVVAALPVCVTEFAAVEFPGNPDEAAATREAVTSLIS
jgi:hypothetical protein